MIKSKDKIKFTYHAISLFLVGMLPGFSCGLLYGKRLTTDARDVIKADKVIREKSKKELPERVTILVTGANSLETEKEFIKELEKYPSYHWISEHNGYEGDIKYKRVTLFKNP
ncbi:MAG: hypothetical protein ACRCX8_20805 [Sarcina sp.]